MSTPVTATSLATQSPSISITKTDTQKNGVSEALKHAKQLLEATGGDPDAATAMLKGATATNLTPTTSSPATPTLATA
jgi:hypothetical protein